jgi:hypothetical protein
MTAHAFDRTEAEHLTLFSAYVEAITAPLRSTVRVRPFQS